jgi:SAM-dependent methyltransferase
MNINEKVLNFYKQLPFNCTSSPEIAAEEIRRANILPYYFGGWESLFKVKERAVLEIGCGTGWLSNMIKYYYKSPVVGIDFNPKAIGFAKEVGAVLLESGERAEFKTANLFEYEDNSYDIVVSIGVLHHTDDCLGGIKKACELTKKSGHIIIGLYNAFGRRPFLDYFAKLKDKGLTEEELFAEYRKIDSRHKDETLAKSWFYDQVLHPHETLHTLKEVNKVYADNGVKMISTSINNYNDFEDLNTLYQLETKLYDKGMYFLTNQKYYSGFFIVIGQKY